MEYNEQQMRILLSHSPELTEEYNSRKDYHHDKLGKKALRDVYNLFVDREDRPDFSPSFRSSFLKFRYQYEAFNNCEDKIIDGDDEVEWLIEKIGWKKFLESVGVYAHNKAVLRKRANLVDDVKRWRRCRDQITCINSELR